MAQTRRSCRVHPLHPLKTGTQMLVTMCTKNTRKMRRETKLPLSKPCRAWHYLSRIFQIIYKFSRLILHVNPIILLGNRWTTHQVEGIHQWKKRKWYDQCHIRMRKTNIHHTLTDKRTSLTQEIASPASPSDFSLAGPSGRVLLRTKKSNLSL